MSQCGQENMLDSDAVVEALVREHLTKKQYTRSLAEFKQEQPAIPQPINKRSTLQDLLGLTAPPEPASAATRTKPLNSSTSTLELFVQQHLAHKKASTVSTVDSSSSAGLFSTGRDRLIHASGSAPQSSSSTKHPSSQRHEEQALLHQPPPAAAVATAAAGPAAAAANSAVTILPLDAPRDPLQCQHNQQQSWQRRLPSLTQQQQQEKDLARPDSTPHLVSRPVPPAKPAAAAPSIHHHYRHPQQHQQQQQQQKAGQLGTHNAPQSASPMGAASKLPQQFEELVVCDLDTDTLDDDTLAPHSTQQQQQQQQQQSISSLKQQQDQCKLLPTPAAAAAVGRRLRTPSGSSTCSSAWSTNAATNSSGSSGGGCGSNGGSSSRFSAEACVPTQVPSLACFQPLSPDHQRRLVQLVWGGGGVQPGAAWQQGLVWSDVPGLEWGLVQLAGGPCGMLAAVQAHFTATLMEQQLWSPTQPNTLTTTHSSGRRSSSSSSSSTAAVSRQQLQEALISSLAVILWTCATSDSSGSSGDGCGSNDSSSSRAACVLVLGGGTVCSSAGVRGLCDAAQVVREAQVATAHSLQDTQALVRSALPQWMQHKGWGLLMIVYSALLSRSCNGAQSDMDTDTPLVDSLGYCSMELVNLLLTGTAVSNVFDGQQCFGEVSANTHTTTADGSAAAGTSLLFGTAGAAGDGAGGAGKEVVEEEEQLVIKGVAGRSRVGLLTLFEWYRYVEVGSFLKSPQLPVWVVCSESHFSVLALGHTSGDSGQGHKQQQQGIVDTAVLGPGGGGVPLLLQYYDGLSQQEGPIVLEVRAARCGEGWSSRMEGVAEERGVWQGRPIPPLECVLETKWRDVAVTWHGSDPIL